MFDVVTIFTTFFHTCDNYGEMKFMFRSELLWLLWFWLGGLLWFWLVGYCGWWLLWLVVGGWLDDGTVDSKSSHYSTVNG